MDMVQFPPLSHQRLRGWQAFALLLGVLGELFLAGDWYGFAAVMPFVMKSLSLTPVEAGFTQGTFAITYALGMVFWSPRAAGCPHVPCLQSALPVPALQWYCKLRWAQ